MSMPADIIAVRLSPYELALAADVGVRRYLSVLQKNLPDLYGYQGEPGSWERHIEGACGELSVAKALGIYWDGSVDTFQRGGDVGAAIQVRTRSKDDYELLVRDTDKDHAVFFLVTGRSGVYRIIGWMRASEAKRAEWRRTHQDGRPAAYFVPHRALHPVREYKRDC